MTARERLLPALAAVLLAGFLLACAILVAGWEFGADDVRVVRDYSVLDAGGEAHVDWSRVSRDWTERWQGNPELQYYRPVVSTSLALDFAISGFAPGFTAAVNVLVHALAAALLAWLALLVFPDRKSALAAAALFACTPLAHENLAWAVGRCGLTVPLGLLAALSLLRARAGGQRGARQHLFPLLWTALNLGTMESAVVWSLFPVICVALKANFDPERERLPWRELAFLTLPYLGAVLIYLGWRYSVLDAFLGTPPVPMQPGTVQGWLTAPLQLLHESVVPRDAAWFGNELHARLWLWLCLLPVGLGLLAPLWFPDPRSRRYRRATLLLLVFWFLSRIPNLQLRIGEGLEASRAAYYSYPALALLLALLFATSRYAFWLGLVCAAGAAAMLWQRLDVRIVEAERGRAALERLAVEAEGRPTPLAFVNQVNGRPGAPAYHAGEISQALAPPFVDSRIPAITLHTLISLPPHELGVAAALADAAGGLFWCKNTANGVRFEWPDLAPYRRPLPQFGPEDPDFARDLDPMLAQLPEDGVLALFVAGAPAALRVSLPRNTPAGAWQRSVQPELDRWRRLLGTGASIAIVAELRTDPEKPESATARTAVQFHTIR